MFTPKYYTYKENGKLTAIMKTKEIIPGTFDGDCTCIFAKNEKYILNDWYALRSAYVIHCGVEVTEITESEVKDIIIVEAI